MIRPRPVTVRVWLVSLWLPILAGCGSTPTAPPPPPAAPTVSCPASQTIEAPDNLPMPVTFTVPTAAGGQAPVSVSCSSPSGASFPLGSSAVTCTATDALQRTASCTFTVTVTATPRISRTRFLAFGDSITFGRCHVSPQICDPYTVRLKQLLEARYTRQTFTVTNVGISGEIASDDIAEPLGRLAGQDRIGDELGRHAPEVLLLMEGANDLINASDRPTFAVDAAAFALERMVEIAQARGITVLLATVTPQRYPAPPGTNNRDASAPLVPVLNERIRAIALRRNAIFVDTYTPMFANLAGTISVDNLHPTEQGLSLLADTFFAAIRQALDTTPASAFGFR